LQNSFREPRDDGCDYPAGKGEKRERERERRERKEKERKISPLLDRAASSRRGHAKDRKIDEDCIS
jgi:hypothetical protein